MMPGTMPCLFIGRTRAREEGAAAAVARGEAPHDPGLVDSCCLCASRLRRCHVCDSAALAASLPLAPAAPVDVRRTSTPFHGSLPWPRPIPTQSIHFSTLRASLAPSLDIDEISISPPSDPPDLVFASIASSATRLCCLRQHRRAKRPVIFLFMTGRRHEQL